MHSIMVSAMQLSCSENIIKRFNYDFNVLSVNERTPHPLYELTPEFGKVFPLLNLQL